MVVIPGPFQDPMALESIYNQASNKLNFSVKNAISTGLKFEQSKECITQKN
jgi:hypothetical protein